ncbi:hypothetical protein [Nitrososphaera sp.]|uniref:hypothetical protein n=1 Tax=Nitrososphaera sp. TaxID=1971748 RepID=UPI001800D6C5|nr:hypothetical protein [Nitrososphaera sp.]NWG38014.1 hypothetical protein [Nitrososphaera sp.]
MVTPIQLDILRRLYNDNKIGGSHTAIENLKKGVPSHMRGMVEKQAKELIKLGYILPKPTSYGLQVSLNPRMIPDIERLLGIS